MSQTFSAGQSRHRDCLNVLITLIDFPGEQAEHFEVRGGVYGKRLVATRFNTWAGKRVRPTTYTVPVDGKVHLFASEWEGLFYAVEFDQYYQRHACTCEQVGCEHIHRLLHLPPISPSYSSTFQKNRRKS